MAGCAVFLLLSLYIYVADCTFPKCEDIVQSVDGKPNCAFCGSERMKKECKAICDSKCNAQPAVTSSPNTGGGNKSPSSSSNKAGSANSTANKKPSDSANNNANKKPSGSDNGSDNKKPTGNGNKGVSKKSSNDSNDSGNGSCNKLDPCVGLEEANKKYRQRCKENGIQDNCLEYCRYDASKTELVYAFTHHICELSQARDLLYAAANNKDNSYCCTKMHVLDGFRQVCEPFCNPDSDNWPTRAEAKYLKCLNLFDTIMHCHWASARP